LSFIVLFPSPFVEPLILAVVPPLMHFAFLPSLVVFLRLLDGRLPLKCATSHLSPPKVDFLPYSMDFITPFSVFSRIVFFFPKIIQDFPPPFVSSLLHFFPCSVTPPHTRKRVFFATLLPFLFLALCYLAVVAIAGFSFYAISLVRPVSLIFFRFFIFSITRDSLSVIPLGHCTLFPPLFWPIAVPFFDSAENSTWPRGSGFFLFSPKFYPPFSWIYGFSPFFDDPLLPTPQSLLCLSAGPPLLFLFSLDLQFRCFFVCIPVVCQSPKEFGSVLVFFFFSKFSDRASSLVIPLFSFKAPPPTSGESPFHSPHLPSFCFHSALKSPPPTFFFSFVK